MIRKLLIAISLFSAPVMADPVDQSGYVLGCDGKVCAIFSAGLMLHVVDDGSTPERIISELAHLPPLTSVRIKGEVRELSGATPKLTLTGLAAIDDPNAKTLRLLQGTWASVGTKPAVVIQIGGLTWSEVVDGQRSARLLITPGSACADGTAAQGTVLSLHPQTAEPAEAACWHVDQVDETSLSLTDLKGGAGKVSFSRMVN